MMLKTEKQKKEKMIDLLIENVILKIMKSEKLSDCPEEVELLQWLLKRNWQE